MRTRIITRADIDDVEIRQLYESAFPKEEQIPWNSLMRLTATLSLDFTAYYNDEQFIGLTIVYPRQQGKPVWFWYFAVCEEYRGKGYGQQILLQLKEKYEKSAMILDMESPEQVCDNSAQRKRRRDFYLRNGFRETGVMRSFKGVEYTIMICGEGTFTTKDYDDILNELRAFWTAMPNADK